jgi:hypothetical protein
MWLPPAATSPPPFVGSTRACEVAAQFHAENNSEWVVHKATYALPARESYEALQNHARRVSAIPKHHRTIFDNDLAEKWDLLLTFWEQETRAQEHKTQQEQEYQEVLVRHMEMKRQLKMQKLMLDEATKELAKVQRVVERYEEVLQLHREY